MQEIAKILISVGLFIIVLGLLLIYPLKNFPIGRLPGDITIEKPNFKFYFPITTMILLSIILSVVLFLIKHFRK